MKKLLHIIKNIVSTIVIFPFTTILGLFLGLICLIYIPIDIFVCVVCDIWDK